MHTYRWSGGLLAHIFYTVLALSIGLYIGTSWYHLTPWHSKITQAVAVVHPTKGNEIEGIVTFEQKHDGVQVQVMCQKAPPGKHGFHVHETGDASCGDGMCTGDHFNPTHTKHGGPQSAERHVGDFGNLEADAQGNINTVFVDKYISLNGPHSIIGRSVIIHADADDLTSQPSGNSGKRIGCGVIGIK